MMNSDIGDISVGVSDRERKSMKNRPTFSVWGLNKNQRLFFYKLQSSKRNYYKNKLLIINNSLLIISYN